MTDHDQRPAPSPAEIFETFATACRSVAAALSEIADRIDPGRVRMRELQARISAYADTLDAGPDEDGPC